jgi:cytosine/adenosine deaminase-related metal-dependent hydrolase
MMFLRARAILPISGPPIVDGGVWVAGGRIREVGLWKDFSARHPRRSHIDLGEVLLLPGLVNAHCHLDYTNMAGQFPPPKLFTDWLKVITVTKGVWSQAEYASSWRAGAEMLLRTGTTTVGDIEAVPALLPKAWSWTPLRVLSFVEMIGIGRRPPRLIVEETLARIRSWPRARWRVGLSPHAPYSTVPELLQLSSRAARRRKWRLAVHVAESVLEFEMFSRARGPMFDWLLRSKRDSSDCGLRSPVRHLEECGVLGENFLGIHANYLGPGDAALLFRRGAHVVHCPRSHYYFRHAPFPLPTLRRAGVNICLGTDSLASVYKKRRETVTLDMFEEMRALSQAAPGLSPRAILEMATRNGARALGFAGKIGELSPGAFADLIAVPFSGRHSDTYEAVLGHRGAVSASMIGGRWAMPPRTVKIPAIAP